MTFKEGTVASFDKGRVTNGNLSKDQLLFISGEVGTRYEFKAATNTSFNSKGEVTAGVLAKEQDFFPNGVAGFRVPFQAATIVFNNKGQVVSGSIAKGAPAFMPLGSVNPGLSLPVGTAITFNNVGQVVNVFLRQDTKLATAQGEHLFKKGSFVTGATA